MPIPLVDVAWQHRQVRAELDRVFDQMLTDPTCDGAEFCARLEAEFTAYMGGEIHAVSVQSGLAAEFLALKALGIGPGDEVITVANSDMATTAAISHVGARFVLVDIDARTHNIDPARIEAACTPRTRAIMPVHMYGLPAEMDAIRAIAHERDLLVIEDATLALGARYRGAKIGTLGDAAFFSFAPRKVIGSIGNGGMVVTRDEAVAHRIRLYKGYGLDPARGERPIGERHLDAGLAHLVEGHNLKIDGIQAAVVSAKLAHLDAWGTLRQQVAERYTAGLSGVPGVQTPQVPAYVQHGWRNYVISVPEQLRDPVRAHLQVQGITTSVLYTPPVHRQPVYSALGIADGQLANAEAVARTLLCLPIYPGMTDEQVDFVLFSLLDALGAAA